MIVVVEKEREVEVEVFIGRFSALDCHGRYRRAK